MKICIGCGALFLVTSPTPYECKACTNAGDPDDSGDGMDSVPLRDLTEKERRALWDWLAAYSPVPELGRKTL